MIRVDAGLDTAKDVAHCSIIICSAAKPSVNAARPGCKIRDDLISACLDVAQPGIAQSRGDALGPKLLATPRANDQIGRPRDYLVSCHNTAPGGALDMRADRRVSFPYILTSQHNGNE